MQSRRNLANANASRALPAVVASDVPMVFVTIPPVSRARAIDTVVPTTKHAKSHVSARFAHGSLHFDQIPFLQANVQGMYCDQCKEGFIGLNEHNVEGCRRLVLNCATTANSMQAWPASVSVSPTSARSLCGVAKH